MRVRRTIFRAEPVAAAAILAVLLLGLAEAAGSESAEIVIQPKATAVSVGSGGLAQQAWLALEKGKHDIVMATVDECVRRFSPRARKQQALLKEFAPPERAAYYSALNDVGTCLFILGRSLQAQKRNEAAKEVYREIIDAYGFAQCWDTKGWFWKVAPAARDQIAAIDFGVDFGDYTSASLTAKAWRALETRNYRAVEMYTTRCIDLYGKEARAMQGKLQGFAPQGDEFSYWALNDVGTCLFIRARALQRQGKSREADQVYREIVETYPSALCYDPAGWFWKVAWEAKKYLLTSYRRP